MGSVFLLYGIGGVLLIAISLPMMYDKEAAERILWLSHAAHYV